MSEEYLSQDMLSNDSGVRYVFGVGITGYRMIRYDTIRWPTIEIIPRYRCSAMINMLLDNPITMHHDIYKMKS